MAHGISHYMITAISAVSITIFWLGLQLDFPSISLPKTVLPLEAGERAAFPNLQELPARSEPSMVS
jgi:hypothetical protein